MNQITTTVLKVDADEILQRVEDDGEQIEIVRDGRVVARLVPMMPGEPADKRHDTNVRDLATPGAASRNEQAHTISILDELDQLAEEIGRTWPKDISAVEAVRDVRRDL